MKNNEESVFRAIIVFILIMLIAGCIVGGFISDIYNTLDNIQREVGRAQLELDSFERLLGYESGMEIIDTRIEFKKIK